MNVMLNNDLKSGIEIKAKEALEIDVFNSISLVNIKNKVSSILNQIGRNGIFGEYTKHDISHVNSMLNLVPMITEQSFDELSSAESLMITLSIYFHDLGMLVTKKEFDSRNNNEDYVLFKSDFKKESREI
ncbi:hypothetical protein ACOB3G_002711, partial [Vibrio cholerae]